MDGLIDWLVKLAIFSCNFTLSVSGFDYIYCIFSILNNKDNYNTIKLDTMKCAKKLFFFHLLNTIINIKMTIINANSLSLTVSIVREECRPLVL